ncbi:rho GTPase activator [Aspergillus sp. HF37]|nr:rho GTPase activator [Aspergillus sp. HF37]
MVTDKPRPAANLQPFPPAAAHHSDPASPPSKRDLASWWRQFKRGARKDDAKDKPQGIFGVPLNVSIKYANVAISLTNDNGESFVYGYVPIVIAKCGVFLKEKATDVEGIFRLNGSAKRIKDLQEIFDSPERYGKGLDWTGYTVHDAANVLRRYLNQLPEPIVPLEFYERFREPLRVYQMAVMTNGSPPDAEQFDHPKAVAAYQQLIRELPPLNKQLLLYILDLLAVFASKSEQNRMPSANLAAIFQPGLLSHPNHYMSPDEYKLSQDVLIFLIENQDHFLFGMNGTAADEQTMKEVESGFAPRPAAYSNVRRSVSSASNGRESLRKYDGVRRNVSVSSKNSRNSNNQASQATTGVGVHRSNTVPSKMSPAIPPSRFARAVDPTANSPGLTPPASHSRSTSRTPPGSDRVPATQELQVAGTGVTYTHSATHGPVPRRNADHSNKLHRNEGVPTATSPPPAFTPTKERKISSFFSKSPPPSAEKEGRQPNRLKKRRIPDSASESAQSSSLSLQAATTDSSLNPAQADNAAGEATPRAAVASNPAEEAVRISRDGRDPRQSDRGNNHADNPHASRTPSRNSSYTDRSGEQPDEASKAERKEHRRSWRFRRPSKRSNEQLGLGLASPPLAASGTEHSTSSFGSGHHSAKSSPSDLQQFAADPSAQPLSLDAEVAADPERKSLFGKFKAKVAQVREGVRDRDFEREKSTSPVQSEAASRTLSPSGQDGKPLEAKDEPTSPGSAAPSSGPPPAIPEEPNTPERPGSAPKGLPVEAPGTGAPEATPVAAETSESRADGQKSSECAA